VKDWTTIEHAAQCAKNEREKRKAYSGISRIMEKALPSELEKIIEATKDGFIRKQAEVELWWRAFDKKPKNLLEFIQTSNDKDKIGNAIIELGNLKSRDAVNILIDLLDDTDLREAAAMALRQMPTQKSFRPLVRSIKKQPEGVECLLYTLQVIDCSGAAEFLIDLFISNPDAPVVRDDIYVCFAEGAVKKISKTTKKKCCQKLISAIQQSNDEQNKEDLEQFYKVVNDVKTSS
jgi:hypothetical protein